ncbi:hypothetical protein LXL04_020987 [Taraxacum kok-saghyz]
MCITSRKVLLCCVKWKGNYRVCWGFTRKFKISEAESPTNVKDAFKKYSGNGIHMTADQLPTQIPTRLISDSDSGNPPPPTKAAARRRRRYSGKDEKPDDDPSLLLGSFCNTTPRSNPNQIRIRPISDPPTDPLELQISGQTTASVVDLVVANDLGELPANVGDIEVGGPYVGDSLTHGGRNNIR